MDKIDLDYKNEILEEIKKQQEEFRQQIWNEVGISAKKYSTSSPELGHIDFSVIKKYCSWLSTKSDSLFETRYEYPEFKECCLKLCKDAEVLRELTSDIPVEEEIEVYINILQR